VAPAASLRASVRTTRSTPSAAGFTGPNCVRAARDCPAGCRGRRAFWACSMAKTDPPARGYPPTTYVFGAFGNRLTSIKKGRQLRAHRPRPHASVGEGCPDTGLVAHNCAQLTYTHDVCHGGCRWLEAGGDAWAREPVADKYGSPRERIGTARVDENDSMPELVAMQWQRTGDGAPASWSRDFKRAREHVATLTVSQSRARSSADRAPAS
jgi:hypothetical protein